VAAFVQRHPISASSQLCVGARLASQHIESGVSKCLSCAQERDELEARRQAAELERLRLDTGGGPPGAPAGGAAAALRSGAGGAEEEGVDEDEEDEEVFAEG